MSLTLPRGFAGRLRLLEGIIHEIDSRPVGPCSDAAMQQSETHWEPVSTVRTWRDWSCLAENGRGFRVTLEVPQFHRCFMLFLQTARNSAIYWGGTLWHNLNRHFVHVSAFPKVPHRSKSIIELLQELKLRTSQATSAATLYLHVFHVFPPWRSANGCLAQHRRMRSCVELQLNQMTSETRTTRIFGRWACASKPFETSRRLCVSTLWVISPSFNMQTSSSHPINRVANQPAWPGTWWPHITLPSSVVPMGVPTTAPGTWGGIAMDLDWFSSWNFRSPVPTATMARATHARPGLDSVPLIEIEPL